MESREYIFVKREVLQFTGIDLNSYKEQQVQRRLRTYLLRSGYANWPAYFRHMKDDQTELNKLKDYLTINVTAFFRDYPKFAYLQENILPDLLRARPRLRVWSAGCSNGQEPYSLAMMLAEVTRISCRHTILATDVDHSALKKAQNGGPYIAEELASTPEEWRLRYFTANSDETYHVANRLRHKVEFNHHNLLSDTFEDNFDLIVCRNVTIYFTKEVKRRLYQRFYDALRPGGVLFIGGTEIIFKARDLGFESAGISFYRKL